MSKELISRKTRIRCRELFAEWFSPHDIDIFFQSADLEPSKDYVAPVGITGSRALVERYYANVLWDSPSSVSRIVRAFENAIERFEELGAHRAINSEAVPDIINPLLKSMMADGFTFAKGKFYSPGLNLSLVTTNSLVRLTEASIAEHIEKGRAKIESRDFAGAIASSYTLVEVFLKQILVQLNVAFNRDEGDIRKLYQLAADPLHLNPKGENLESFLKSILQGLKSQLMGLYELANKGSDRHARQYNPARHHAKLAVNVAFTLCEFLLESFEYQQQRKRKTAGSK